MLNGYKIIDTHAHVFPAKIASKASRSIAERYEYDGDFNGTVEELLEYGVGDGVDFFVVSSVATTEKQVHSANAFLAEEAVGHPDRIAALGTYYPRTSDPEGDFQEALDYSFKGIKIHPDMQGFYMDDEGYTPLYQMAAEANLPILVHTGDERYDWSNVNRSLPVYKAFPKTTFIGAHLSGYRDWIHATQVLSEQKLDNLYVDISSCFYALSNEEMVACIRAFGADRCMYGTDYPSFAEGPELKRFFELGLTDEENRLILSETARKVYRLDI